MSDAIPSIRLCPACESVEIETVKALIKRWPDSIAEYAPGATEIKCKCRHAYLEFTREKAIRGWNDLIVEWYGIAP